MKRDGSTISIWQEGVPVFEPNSDIPPGSIFDVVVVGGGMTGISTALELQRSGKSVLVAEAQTLGFGTTGGTSAHLNSFFESPYNQIIRDFGEKNAQLLAEAGRKALDLIRNNVETYSIDCAYKQLPAWLYAQDEDQCRELEEIREASKKVGMDVDYSTHIPVNIPFLKALVFNDQGQFHPTLYLLSLAREFQQRGGIIAEHCRVTAVEGSEPLRITTTSGTIKAKNLIYATHIPPGVNLLHFRCAPYRSYVMAIKLKNESDYPQGLAYDMFEVYHYFRTQEINGQRFLIVGGEDHKTGHEENTEKCFTRLESYVRKHYDVDEISYRWSSQYYNPADGLPYIGHLPGHSENMFVATGFGGNGMTFSHVAAITLTELINTGDSRYKKLLNPNRVRPIAGFKDFIKESADVVGIMINSLFPRDKLEELAQLAPGEGRIVKYEEHSLALYKDEEGMVHALNPACTHVKCMVTWNTAEKSWDCPCHGSRFSPDGEVLTAPARKDLQFIPLEELVERE